jgi:uncharacterized membrane protein
METLLKAKAFELTKHVHQNNEHLRLVLVVAVLVALVSLVLAVGSAILGIDNFDIPKKSRA